MKTVETSDFVNESGDLLEEIEKGGRIVVQRDGVPIAEIVPIARTRKKTPDGIRESFARIRETTSRGDMSIKEMRDEGRP